LLFFADRSRKALINTLRQLSDSVHIVQYFQDPNTDLSLPHPASHSVYPPSPSSSSASHSSSPSHSTPEHTETIPVLQTTTLVGFLATLLLLSVTLYIVRANQKRCETRSVKKNN
jgi:hypothetical protein